MAKNNLSTWFSGVALVISIAGCLLSWRWEDQSISAFILLVSSWTVTFLLWIVIFRWNLFLEKHYDKMLDKDRETNKLISAKDRMLNEKERVINDLQLENQAMQERVKNIEHLSNYMLNNISESKATKSRKTK